MIYRDKKTGKFVSRAKWERGPKGKYVKTTVTRRAGERIEKEAREDRSAKRTSRRQKETSRSPQKIDEDVFTFNVTSFDFDLGEDEY
jgi:hypothetical protein